MAQGYRVVVSAPFYLNLGSLAASDWETYYTTRDLRSFKAPAYQVGWCRRMIVPGCCLCLRMLVPPPPSWSTPAVQVRPTPPHL
jgi:hypothetical protein